MFHILLVDDDADVRRLVKKILEKAGHSVIAVENGLSALGELNENHYDLLLSDANMPQYNGFDLVRAIRRLPKHKDLIIAMLTGRRDKNDIQKAVELGVNDYIVKPVDPEVLVNKIQKLLESRIPDPAFINLPETTHVNLEASVQSPLRMKKIGLSSFMAVSPYPLAVGLDFYLNIDEMDYEALPKVRIIASQPDPHNNKQYLIHGTFLEMDDQFKEQIKKCLRNYTAA
ncbi:MAG: response regulator [Bdellovibrionaceae bacterium]|nr:response regulator [Pseudobdellovibrionaceae bacterium]